MKTVNSLSGGKTSSYLAKHYPADFEIFSLIRIEDNRCTPKDKSIVRYVEDKINMEFIATAESDRTLYVMRDLEQLIGREIIWVTGETFEQVCLKRKALPNFNQRFCTTELKMRPIGDWWLNNINEKVLMQVGFRYDEIERMGRFTNEIKLKIGKHPSGRNKWKTFDWRIGGFPLIEDKKTHFEIYQWAKSTGIDFPDDSNCVGCFWKPEQQLRKNWDEENLKMQWFSDLENKLKRRFKGSMTYEDIKKIGLQMDFIFGTGSGCSSGGCTN